jgi:hypothetical protein
MNQMIKLHKSKDLTRRLVNKNYCDNFFTSIPLFSDLLMEGIYACGTIRANRKGVPSDLKLYVKNGFPERGQCEIRHCENNTNLTVSVWQD